MKNKDNRANLRIVSPQTDNGHLRIANELLNEIIARDFSKRQLKILFFIFRLSWGCQKKYAVIPQLKDFEACGVKQNHIKNEILLLEKARIIYWLRESNIFFVNKFYDYWNMDILPEMGSDKIKVQVGKQLQLPKTGSEELTNFLKREPKLPKMVSEWFLKRELCESYSPDTEPKKDLPKESIKERKEKIYIKEIVKEIFSDEQFVDIVNDWLAYKKEIKNSYKGSISVKGFCRQLNDFSGGDPNKARKIIEQSIANNYKGIFELKEAKKPSSNGGYVF